MTAHLGAKLRRLNSELNFVTAGCHHDRPCPAPVVRAVEDSGFNAAALDRRYEPEGQGRAHFEIGFGVWMTLSWYKLPVTGRFEVVAYAN